MSDHSFVAEKFEVVPDSRDYQSVCDDQVEVLDWDEVPPPLNGCEVMSWVVPTRMSPSCVMAASNLAVMASLDLGMIFNFGAFALLFKHII